MSGVTEGKQSGYSESMLKFEPWNFRTKSRTATLSTATRPLSLSLSLSLSQFTDSPLCLASHSITTGATVHSSEESHLRQVERATFSSLLINSWPPWFSSGPVYVFPSQSLFDDNCSQECPGVDPTLGYGHTTNCIPGC